MPRVMERRIFMVFVLVPASKNWRAQEPILETGYILAKPRARLAKSWSEYLKGFVLALSSIGYSGRVLSKCSSVTTLSKLSSQAVPSKVAIATELSNG